jgi:hypothetical protein
MQIFIDVTEKLKIFLLCCLGVCSVGVQMITCLKLLVLSLGLGSITRNVDMSLANRDIGVRRTGRTLLLETT